MTPDEIQFWILWVRIGTLAVSMMGIGLVYWQLHKIGETIRGNAFSSSFAELRELHKVFIENPDLRPFFYDNKLPPNDVAESPPEDVGLNRRANAVAEMFLDAFIHMYLLRPRFPEELKHHIDLFIEDMVQSSGFLADYLRQNARFIPVELRAVILGFINTRATKLKLQGKAFNPAARTDC